MKNFIIPLLFFGAFFITINCNCNKDEDCIKNYNFETHYNLTPTQDSFSIGDTIWISCDFSNQLYDRGGDSINFTGQSLLAEFFLGRIDTSPYIQNYQDFEFIENIGQLNFFSLSGSAGFDLIHEVSNERFQIEFGVIPLSSGLYQFTLSSGYNLNNITEPELNINVECEEYVDYFDLILNNSMNNNFELLQNANDEAWKSLPEDDFNRNGGFCFYVVE